MVQMRGMNVIAAPAGISVVTREDFFSFVVTGPERKSWLQGLLTGDVSAVGPRAGAWSLALTKQGKIVADLVLLENADEELWVGGTEAEPGAFAKYLDAFLIMEDAEVREASSECVWIFAFGQNAWGTLSGARPGTMAQGQVSALGVGTTAWVVQRNAQASFLQSVGELDAVHVVVDAEEWLRLRLRLGLPLFGTDFSGDENPHQASLERRAVDWQKGCYLGQEVVCMQEMRGKVKRRLVRLEVEQAAPVAAGAAVFGPEGAFVGEVTSSVQADGQQLAYARVKAPYFDGSVPLLVGGAAARVVAGENGSFASKAP
ncbi:MAG: hypothetical protein SFV15_04390 [Polyangiaceae bacterium]|nr:hypothetical protein [Polyangiaceae bacterium]